MTYAPTAIDVSRLPPPTFVEIPDYEAELSAFKAAFIAAWERQRLTQPDLEPYDMEEIEADPINALAEAKVDYRVRDLMRVNDAFRALIAHLSKGSNLDAVVANRNIARRITPAVGNVPERRETDASLLNRYLLSFDKPSAGSDDRYLYDAYTAWPQMDDGSGLHHARVNGFDVHGRRGDVDVVIIGPGGRLPTEEERVLVRNAVTAQKPNATSVSVLAATRLEYSVSLVIEVPPGPDPAVVAAEAEKRVRAAADERTLIGGEIPRDYLSGAAYGPSVIRVVDLAPVEIPPHPYTVPVLTSISVVPEVRE